MGTSWKGAGYTSSFWLLLTVIMVATFSTICVAQQPSNPNAKPIKVTVGGNVALHIFLPAQIAQRQGFFTAHGLQVEFINMENAPLVGNAIAAGSVDVGLGIVDSVFQLRSKGEDVVGIAGLIDVNIWNILVRSDIDVPHLGQGWQPIMRDLKGLKFGVTARGAGGETVVRILLAEAGLDPDKDATYIPVGALQTAIAALSQKQIEAWAWIEPGVTITTKQLKIAKLAIKVKEEGPKLLDWDMQFWFGKRSMFDKNPELVKGFQAANREAINWMKDPANRDALIKIAMDAMRIDAQLADVVITSTLADFASNMRLDGLKNAEAALLKTGLISKKVDVEAFCYPGSL
jgi:NitT/TauT family transport system substrate-binding protein